MSQYGPPHQPQYPPLGYPPQYPPQQGYPPQQQYPPQQGYPPQQQYPPQGYPPQGYPPPQQGYPPQQGGQPIVIPILGTGAAKLGAKLGGQRNFVFTPECLTQESKRAGFRIWWTELAAVTITTAYHQNRGSLASQKTWRVRVILDAADQGFLQRHPDFAKYEAKFGGTGPNSFGLALGPVENIVAPLANAFATCAGSIFRGVVDEGQVIGFGYL